MDADTSSHVEKSPLPSSPAFSEEEALAATRTVAFDGPLHQGDINEEKIHHGHLRPRGVEMKREMTKEDKELADAGYEHLNQQKTQPAKAGDAGLDNVDIHEHKLSFEQLLAELDTAFDAKDPSISPGLSGEEAKARLSCDGQNVLTPPKKKAALRKVRNVTSLS